MEWPLIDWMNKNHMTAVGLLSRNAEWKRIRSFLQKDLLAPQSAREYLPGILQGQARAMDMQDVAQTKDINRYLNICALEQFSAVLFGGRPGLSDEEYAIFCNDAVDTLAAIFEIVQDPWQNLVHSLGITTSRVRDFEAGMERVYDLAKRRLSVFKEEIERGQVTEEQRNSYFYKIMQRQPESDVTEDEAMDICVLLMIAAVDTTAGKTSWNLLQLGLNPEAQEALYQQLLAAVEKEGGLTPEIFDGRVPLLQAFIRETHRCTPALPGDIIKKISTPTEVYGVTLPAESPIMFDALTVQMDPDIMEEPMAFKPERWLKEAIEARKDTPAAIIDHPFYSGPFSQGARRCPGSRVASLEVQVILTQLLLKYRVVAPPGVHWSEIKSNLKITTVPIFPEGFHVVPRE